MTHVQVLRFPTLIPAPLQASESLDLGKCPEGGVLHHWVSRKLVSRSSIVEQKRGRGHPKQSAYLSWTILDGIYDIYIIIHYMSS